MRPLENYEGKSNQAYGCAGDDAIAVSVPLSAVHVILWTIESQDLIVVSLLDDAKVENIEQGSTTMIQQMNQAKKGRTQVVDRGPSEDRY